MDEPTVLLICGQPGTGKSALLQSIVRQAPDGRIRLLAPGAPPDWDAVDALAVDENWTPVAVTGLESEALACGKHLIVVAQGPETVILRSEPAIITLHSSTPARGTFAYQGQEIAFP
jgi:GTPase SAR1 family protein